MSKPILEVQIETLDERRGRARAVFDTGAHPTIIRESCLPEGAAVVRRAKPVEMRTAAAGGRLRITGATILVMTVGDRVIQDEVLVSPDLAQEMLVGAGTMQKWDISIRNENGHTRVEVGRDLRDPDIQEID
ncbi:MAG: retroviral-like aspartic protease [Deltaproteobacteria bacterium]|nr:retroviral-like aspartic protease [Deltaproteobacteria bacterium]